MNGIHLYLILKEIKDKLYGLYIDEIQQMNRLIQIVCGKKSLYLSLYPEIPAIFFSKTIKQGYEKVKLFSSLRSYRIIKIEQPDFMPILRLQLETKKLSEKENPEIIISLYREAPNIIVKTPQLQKKLFPRFIKKSPKKSLFDLTEQQFKSFFIQDNKTILTKNLVREIEGIDKNLAGELTLENFGKLKSILSGEKIKPRLVSISPFRVSLFATEYIKEYASMNKLFEDGIRLFTETKLEAWVQFQKKQLVRNLEKRIERLKKKLSNDDEIEKHRIIGEMILTNITKINRGIEKIMLFNPYTQKEIEITLNPFKTPQQNAQEYFSKYKKSKRGQPKIRTKIADIRKQIEDIIAKPLKQYESLPHAKPMSPKEKPLPFRTFPLPSGSVVYVGKNAKSNAELTFKFARPNDYFFHVRGYGGAHTLLKARVPKGQKPKKEDIETAAAIAAYYSKAKKQKNVPVSYTQRKYLKKNKKGKPGSVILMKEQVIFVDPGVGSNLDT